MCVLTYICIYVYIYVYVCVIGLVERITVPFGFFFSFREIIAFCGCCKENKNLFTLPRV